MSYNRSTGGIVMPIALHHNHDDSRKPVEPTAGTMFTTHYSSAVLPFSMLHGIGYPPQGY
ncbi:MAG: hypothetical protein K2I00_03145 [Ruminococcus sp.]|nr:hypothetical protein [Ruminococcus sp.]